MTHANPQDESTAAAATDGAPGKQHGDPLLAASEGAQEGTEGTRHGVDLDAATGDAPQE
jgi:hypothetical protein